MERFDTVRATFRPVRMDDLKPHALAWVGVRMRWVAAWEIESGPYVGQMAMTSHEPTPAGLEPIGWVPLCDLADVEPANVGGNRLARGEPKYSDGPLPEHGWD